MFLLMAGASTKEIVDTNVVSLTFCETRLPAKDKMGKKTLAEVHTYAELKHDPRASLPRVFAVCSTVMVIDSPSWSILKYESHYGQVTLRKHSVTCSCQSGSQELDLLKMVALAGAWLNVSSKRPVPQMDLVGRQKPGAKLGL